MFSAVKVFAATTHNDRATLSERVTTWLMTELPDIVDIVQTQSSDSSYHLIAITIFYNPKPKVVLKPPPIARLRLTFKDAR